MDSVLNTSDLVRHFSKNRFKARRPGRILGDRMAARGLRSHVFYENRVCRFTGRSVGDLLKRDRRLHRGDFCDQHRSSNRIIFSVDKYNRLSRCWIQGQRRDTV